MKHNIYENGNFQNIEFTDNNSNKSIGVIEPGTYSFTTEHEETVQCLTGLLTINGIKCAPGQKITTGKNEKFTISAEETSSYLCLYR